jgi:hypothetical protein
MKGSEKYYLAVVISYFISFSSCQNRNDRLNITSLENESENNTRTTSAVIQETEVGKIGKAVFYIENSESMFGYVQGFTEYVDVISELAEKPDFAKERTNREFYFINGGNDLKITPIGNNPAILKDKLNTRGFRCGDITRSNLNSMFQVALKKAQEDTISILISDAIYDIGQPQAPFNALATEGRETRTKFIERLSYGDLQTIIIKLSSHFEGDYFFTSQRRSQRINHPRPFYIWVFGKSELLNKYFPNDYINSLKGYVDMARFMKFNDMDIPSQAISHNKIGEFRIDRVNKNKLINVKPDRNGRGFKFTFATDFSTLPFSDSYLQSVDNYLCSENFDVSEITILDWKLYEVESFNPTHLISVFTSRSPYCELDISLKNVVPDWIIQTSTHDETNIQNDTTHTFGFEFLINAISEAYLYMNRDNNITNFKFEITSN